MAVNKTIIGKEVLPDGRILEYGARDPVTGQRYEILHPAPTPTGTTPTTPTPTSTPTPTPTSTPALGETTVYRLNPTTGKLQSGNVTDPGNALKSGWYSSPEAIPGYKSTTTPTSATPTEAKPTGWLMTNKSVGKISPGGQWIYTGEFKNGPYGTNGAIVEAWVGEWIPNTKNTGTSPTTPTGASRETQISELENKISGVKGQIIDLQAQQKEETLKNLQNILDTSSTGQNGTINAIDGTTFTAPTAPNLVQTYEQLKNEQGISGLENQIADLDFQINTITSQYNQAITAEGERLSPMAIIQRRQSKLGTQSIEELDRLQNQKNLLETKLSNKLNSVNMILQLTQQDYATSYAQYNDSFNRQLQLQQLFNQKQDAIKSDATANLNTIISSFKDSGIDYSSLPSTMRSKIEALATQAGIAPEFLPYLTKVAQTNDVITTSVNSTNGDLSVLVQDAQGNLSTKLFSGFTEPTAGGVTEQVLLTSRGNDGFVDPGIYLSERANSKLSASQFDDKFSYLLSPKEKTNLGIGISGEKITDAQRTLSGYASRVKQAEPTLKSLETSISGMNLVSFEAQIKLPAAMQSAEIQQYMQAARNFINAVLRRESGAVISPSEFSEARQQYLPQPGDKPATLQLKENNRNNIFENYKNGAGAAYTTGSGGNDNPLNLNF